MKRTRDTHGNLATVNKIDYLDWKRLPQGLFRAYLVLVPTLALVGWITLPQGFSSDFKNVVNTVPLINAVVFLAVILGWFSFVALASIWIRPPASGLAALVLALDTPAILCASAFTSGSLDTSILFVDGLVELAAAAAAFGVHAVKMDFTKPKHRRRGKSDSVWMALIGVVGSATISLALIFAVAKAWSIIAAIAVPIAIVWNALSYYRLFEFDEETVGRKMRGAYAGVGFGLPVIIWIVWMISLYAD